MSEPIVERIAGAYGVRVARLRALDGGSDASAQTFKAVASDGRSFFVKRRTTTAPGIALGAALREAGNPSVLAPSRTLAGEIASISEEGAILLYPYVGGTNGFERELEPAHWRRLGSALRGIHDTVLTEEVASALPVEAFEVRGVDRLLSSVERLLAGGARSIAEERMAALIGDYRADVELAIDRAGRFGRASSLRGWGHVPSHADLHVGNVLVDARGAVHIVDWDGPRLAPRECDLMFMVHGGILGAHGEAEERSFFEGYGEVEMDARLVAYYRYARVVEDLVADCEEATNPAAFLGADPARAVARSAAVLRGARRLNETVPADF